MKTHIQNLRATIESRAARLDDRRPHPRPRRRAVRCRAGGAGQSRRPECADDVDGIAPHPVRRRTPGGGHMHTHMLVDDNGRATKLEVPDSVIAAAGGRTAINQRRVTVRGRTSLRPDVRRIGGAAVRSRRHRGRRQRREQPVRRRALWAPRLSSAGRRSGCRSSAASPIPRTSPRIRRRGSRRSCSAARPPASTTTGARSSFGTVNLTGSVVVGWYTLPQPAVLLRLRQPAPARYPARRQRLHGRRRCRRALPGLHRHQPDVQRRPRLLRLGREHVPHPRRPVASCTASPGCRPGATRARARSRTRWDTASGSRTRRGPTARPTTRAGT